MNDGVINRPRNVLMRCWRDPFARDLLKAIGIGFAVGPWIAIGYVILR